MKFILALITTYFSFLPAANCQDEKQTFEIPRLTAPVMDLAGVMSSEGRAKVESLVRSLYDSGGSQITVLTVKSLGNLTIEEASIKVVDAWKLGRQDKDDGILLMLAPNDRRVRIEVGRGKEGDLPDAWARRVISSVMTPAFREGGFDQGILLGVAAIIQKTDPQFDLDAAGAPRPRVRSGRQGGGSNLLTLLFVLIFILLGPIVALLRMLGFLPRHTGIHSYGGSGWGGGFGGSSGGGGWSGGGGGFSGGGSSGSW